MSNSKKHFEDQFILYWRGLGGPALVREYRFHPERRFRFDYCFLPKKIAFEINGGIWMRGNSGHSSGTGLTRDAEKNLEAVLLGWRVIPLVKSMIIVANIERLIAFVNQ